MITGYLTGFALTDLINFLHSQKESGELTMIFDESTPRGTLGFKHGKLVFAKHALKMGAQALFDLSKSERFMFIFDSKAIIPENIYTETDKILEELYKNN